MAEKRGRRCLLLLWGLVCILCLGGFFLLRHLDAACIAALPDQLGAERWETEGKEYAEAALYLSDEEAIPDESLGTIKTAVEKALTDGGVPSSDYPWYMAASRTDAATLKNGSTEVSVSLTAYSGEYFLLHEMELRSGAFPREDALMHDTVVLCRQAAWELFASDDIAGQYVTMNGTPLYVAAVVDLPEGKYNTLALDESCPAWVFSDCPALPEDFTKSYTAIEMVLPQPIRNFAVSVMKSAVETEETDRVQDISGRFSLTNRLKVLKKLAARGISQEERVLPWYENAALLTENRLARTLLPEGLCLLVPGLSLLLALYFLNRKRTWGLHSIRDFVSACYQRHLEKRYYAKEAIRTREREAEASDDKES